MLTVTTEIMWRKKTFMLVPHIIAGTLSVSANASDTLQLPIGGNPFMITGITRAATAVAALAGFSLNLTPSDSNKSFVSQLVDSSLITGTAQLPFLINLFNDNLPGLIVAAANTITVDLTDTSGSTNVITIALLGYRLQGIR